MTETSLAAQVGRSAGVRPARVLVFNVDDGLFALHIDWVEAMYPWASVQAHNLRNGDGRAVSFVLHRGEPALVIDLRDAFNLTPLLGATQRSEVVLVRSPSFLVALPVDGCVGIRELDLESQPPVPTSLTRDGGFPVGHLVALDGRPMALLDPRHLIEARERDALVPLAHKARAFEERERRSQALWREICLQPSESNLRAYARLCARNGRSKTAAATRTVLRHLEQLAAEGGRRLEVDIEAWDAAAASPSPAAVVPAEERFLREIICLAGEMVSGELIVPHRDGTEESKVFLVGGRSVQAHHGAERGRTAFAQLLAAQPEHFYFVETSEPPAEQRINESTAALLISTLEALSRANRARRPRPTLVPTSA